MNISVRYGDKETMKRILQLSDATSGSLHRLINRTLYRWSDAPIEIERHLLLSVEFSRDKHPTFIWSIVDVPANQPWGENYIPTHSLVRISGGFVPDSLGLYTSHT